MKKKRNLKTVLTKVTILVTSALYCAELGSVNSGTNGSSKVALRRKFGEVLVVVNPLAVVDRPVEVVSVVDLVTVVFGLGAVVGELDVVLAYAIKRIQLVKLLH